MANYNFESSKHLFYWVRKMLKKREWWEFVEGGELVKASKEIYTFKQNNQNTIKSKGLRCPLNQWTYTLYEASKDEIKDAILNYETIISDYKKCFNKTTKYIRNSGYKKYIVWSDDDFRKIGHYDRNDKEHKIFRDKMLNEMDKILGKTGLYKLYNKNKKLIYIGKSHNLGRRIPSSAKSKKTHYFSYAITGNKADTNIYEMYYIAKLNPPRNGADNVEDMPSMNLPELEFTEKKKIYKNEGTTEFLDDYAS